MEGEEVYIPSEVGSPHFFSSFLKIWPQESYLYWEKVALTWNLEVNNGIAVK